MVFKEKIKSIDHFKQRIVECWEQFPQSEIDRAIDAFRSRLRKVIKVNGAHIEHL